MFSSGEMDSLVKQIINQLSQDNDQPGQEPPRASLSGGGADNNPGSGDPKMKISAQKILVVLGLLGGVLEVDSVLVDKAQRVEILLVGSLRRPTRLDKMLDEIGRMPFDDVLRAVFERLS